MIQIICGDCREELKKIKNVTLIFADPPYGIGIDYGSETNDNMNPFEYRMWCQEWIYQCYNSLAPNGSFWMLNSHENTYLLYQTIRDIGFHIRQTIIYYEAFGVNSIKKFNRCSRTILHCVKDKKNFIFNENSPEIRRASDRQEIYNDKRSNPAGKLWDDIWGINPPIPRICGTHFERIPGFPTQLNIKLLIPIIACASNINDLVIDPFSGSGTTGAACIKLQRNYIGIEISEKFCQLSKERLEI